jgi:hypothetical protein
MTILTNRAGTQPTLPIVIPFFQRLNGWDVAALTQAIPQLIVPLQNPYMPRPSFHCQNSPPVPAARDNDMVRLFHMMPQPRLGVRQRCDIPADAIVRQRICEGPRLGYNHNHHGPEFWVCEPCARRSWERYSLVRNPVCYDLCLPCSRHHRTGNPVAALSECSCQYRDSRLHLCTDCYMTRSATEDAADFYRLRGYNSNMSAMHFHANAALAQPDRVAHFVDDRGLFGESSCICGRSATLKTDSYIVPNPPGAPPGQQTHDFTDLVRICSRCRREKFLTMDHPFGN